VPWKAIARYGPFRKILRMNVAFSLASGGVTAFSVAFMKVSLNLSESLILFISASSFIGGLSSLWLLGHRLDQFGSKPTLILVHGVWLLLLAGLSLVAAGVLPAWISILVLIQFLVGLASASVQMANIRLVMATIPEMGRSHFFALFSVTSNVVLGVAPIVWGALIDLLRSVETTRQGWSINRYGLYFTAASIVFVVSMMLCRSLEEPESRSTEAMLRDILTRSRLRAWLRLWPRA